MTTSDSSPSNTGATDDKLFVGLVADLVTQAWVAMGKIKNPLTDEMEHNIPATALMIDMLDMLRRKTEGRRSEEEDKILLENLQQLKLNYLHEVQEDASQTEDKAADESPAADDEGDDEADAPSENVEKADDE